jgi:hypothetical protein
LAEQQFNLDLRYKNLIIFVFYCFRLHFVLNHFLFYLFFLFAPAHIFFIQKKSIERFRWLKYCLNWWPNPQNLQLKCMGLLFYNWKYKGVALGSFCYPNTSELDKSAVRRARNYLDYNRDNGKVIGEEVPIPVGHISIILNLKNPHLMKI